MKAKIVDLEKLSAKTEQLKREGKRIVATGGCFDLIHAGHVEYLEKAKEFGDVLVVFLNSDESVQSLKGPGRPIVDEENRAIVIAGLEAVDYVCIFSEADPCKVIAVVKPDVWVKGADYKGKAIPEQAVIDSYGGRIEYADFKAGCSSTAIIEKIKSDLGN